MKARERILVMVIDTGGLAQENEDIPQNQEKASQGSVWGKAGEFSELVVQVAVMLGFLTCCGECLREFVQLK